MNNLTPDALVVVPPLSPSDTNPPLGPYLLKAEAERLGLRLEVLDLGIRYLRTFGGGPQLSHAGPRLTLGDQDKDRAVTYAARAHYLRTSPFEGELPLHVPPAVDPTLGAHYGFEAIGRAVERACEAGSPQRTFVDRELFGTYPAAPCVVGVSIMGPPQLVYALAVARLAKRRWPGTLVVAGGSHVTLLADEIAREPRYGGDIDLFLPGHCERLFARVLLVAREGRRDLSAWGVVAGTPRPRACGGFTPISSRTSASTPPDFEYLPAIDARALEGYDPARVTLPMQLTRGCSFGKCAYCTYPAVEPVPDAVPDFPRALRAVQTLMDRTGVRRVSFKDSFFTPHNLRLFAERVLAERIPLEWSATTMLSSALSDATLRLLARSGLRTLEFGLETIDPTGQAVFGKRLSPRMVEGVVEAATACGISVVLNQIFAWPGQTEESALQQIDWYLRLRNKAPHLIRASMNLLEVNRGAPMSLDPAKYGVRLGGVAPWAFSYDWNQPPWAASCFSFIQQSTDASCPTDGTA